MIWIIASVPFWITGIGLLAVSLAGISSTIKNIGELSDTELRKSCIGIVMLLASAGAVLLLAAKIAS